MAALDSLTRLVFLGLIGQADDRGRLLDNVKVIDAFIFPETDETCRDGITKLESIGRIERGVTESGQKVIQIKNWERHQRIEKPNFQACLPPISGDESQENVDKNDLKNSSGNDPGQIPEASGKDRIADLRSTIYDRNPCAENRTLFEDGNPDNQNPNEIPAEQIPKRGNRYVYSDEFEKFWEEYPRSPSGDKPGKYKTYTHWKQLSRHNQILLLEATKRYASVQRKYTYNAENFISKRYWHDYLEESQSPDPAQQPELKSKPKRK